MTLPAITNFCDDAGVQKILSVNGVNLRIDDDATALAWAEQEASVEMLEHLQLGYSVTALQNSNWVNRNADWLAARNLCQRRGNPVPMSLNNRCEKIEERLEEARTGAFTLPDAPQTKQNVPVLTNLRQRLIPVPQSVAEPGRSTGNQQGYDQFRDNLDVTQYDV